MSEARVPDPSSLVQAYFAAINHRDPHAWANCFAEDGRAHDPAHAPARAGRESHRAFLEGVLALFTEVEFRALSVHACGAEAAVPFVGRVRTANGATVEVKGVDVFRFDARGSIECVRGYWDPSPMFAAAGV